MEYLDIVEQEAFGVEGCFLVEDEFGGVAAVYILLLVGFEECVRMVYFPQIVKSHASVAVAVSYEPNVGLSATTEHGFEGEGNGTALCVVIEKVTSTGIGNELCHGTASTGEVPCRAVLGVEEYCGTIGLIDAVGECPQCMVLGLNRKV